MQGLLNETAGLLAFVRTVQAGSFSAAAKSLGTTPSFVSKSISRLERLLGATLFRRSTRLLAMTPEGEAFYAKIAPLLHDIESAADVVRSHREPAGHLRVSMPTELGRMILEHIVEEFMPRYPAISLDIGMTDRAVDVLRENYDVVFRVGGTAQDGLMCRTLAHLDMVIVASPSFLDRHGKIDSVDRLEELPFVRYATSGRPYPVPLPDGRELRPKGRLDLDSATAIRDAAVAGVGAAYLIKPIVEADIDGGLLVELLPQMALQTVPLQALHASGRMPSFRQQLFTDFVASVMAKSGA
ncbi:LysR family transcriptional regulator [Rhizobium mayense]|uniref:LysR family transcriptional regulator n=1 Tax=Rhizobium mayense TaxID=1312184 RepID=A0ABT7JSU3_9HYPH|nr:LysR family transcriptional regulator [Rhizobium mayense]MDL2398972.1 LysR family transcriptional regulator [Rhizobium mayense]